MVSSGPRNIKPGKILTHKIKVGDLEEQSPLVAEAAAGNDDAERGVDGLANGDLDRLVVGGQGVGEVGQRLAVVNDRLAADLEREDALVLAVRLLAEGFNDGAVVDGGAHGVDVVAGAEREVVDVDGADLLAEEVVVEGDVALRLVSKTRQSEIGLLSGGNLQARRRQASGWGRRRGTRGQLREERPRLAADGRDQRQDPTQVLK